MYKTFFHNLRLHWMRAAKRPLPVSRAVGQSYRDEQTEKIKPRSKKANERDRTPEKRNF